MNLCFICSGNTCRSPMAEGIFRKMTAGLKNFRCSSAGIGFNNGEPPSKNAIEVCKEIGVDISSHRSRALNFHDSEITDLFVVMTWFHAESLLMAEIPEQKIYVLGGGIPDPYGNDLDIYRKCRDLIMQGLEELYKTVEEYLRSETDKPLNIKIIPMEESHINRIAQLEQICFADPWSEDSLREMLESTSARFLTALCNDDIAGYMGMQFAPPDAYVDNIAVFPKYRRQGVAKALLEHAFMIIQAGGADFLSLEVRPSNTAALNLYQSMGFKTMGVRPNFYRHPKEDALIMTKLFDEDKKEAVE